MGGSAISIGNFDGVHRGHVELIRRARDAVGADGVVIALAFDPHPATVLRPEAHPELLSTFDQRVGWLMEAGADRVEPLVPTPELLAMRPEQFLGMVVDQYAPSVIVEGPDFRFGRGREGSVDTLRQLEATYRYRTIIIDQLEAALSDQTLVDVSSTMLRWLIDRGRVRDAAKLLGRPYQLIGTVVQGEQQGRLLNMPTANLGDNPRLLPADGVYGGEARRPDGAVFPAAISIGTKPTYGARPRVCEAHLIGYEGPLDDYGWTVQLCFCEWIRDQLALPDTDALMAQMQRDVQRIAGRCKVLG
jgi:riboflavin kinase/FMN adenylyltransferase